MRQAHRCNWRCYPGYCIDIEENHMAPSGQTEALDPEVTAILRYFEHDHLPPHLAEVSKHFYDTAWGLVIRLEGDEVKAGLRKLLEAKDCFVRAALDT